MNHDQELRLALLRCLHQPGLKQTFKKFTEQQSCDELLLFLKEVEDYRVAAFYLRTNEERKEKAERVIKDFLRDNSTYAVHADAALRKEVQDSLSEAPLFIFDKIQESVYRLLQNDIYPKFVKSELYKQHSEDFIQLPKAEKDLFIAQAGIPRVVDVTVHAARNLVTKKKPVQYSYVRVKLVQVFDLVPYVEQLDNLFRIDSARKKTKVIRGTSSPEYNMNYSFEVDNAEMIPYLLVEVFSKETFFDTLVGRTLIAIFDFESFDQWVNINKSTSSSRTTKDKRDSKEKTDKDKDKDKDKDDKTEKDDKDKEEDSEKSESKNPELQLQQGSGHSEVHISFRKFM